MAVVQPILITYLANALSEYVQRATVKIDGVAVDFEIYKTIVDGARVRKFLYIVEQKGNISEAALYDSMGRIIAIKPVSIAKDEDGIMIVFEFNLDITEV